MKNKKSEANVVVEIGSYLKKTNLRYELEGGALSGEVLNSLKNNPSKKGGDGGGIPDATFIFSHENETWFGFIECKSGKNNMAKFDKDGFIENRKKDGNANYSNISRFALNGASHYAKNAYRDTDIKRYFVIGACGYEEYGEYKVDVEVYLITPETGGEAVIFDSFSSSFAFLYPENIDETMLKARQAHLTEEQRAQLRETSEASVDNALTTLNQKMRDDFKIDAKWRINIIVAMILAGLGDKNKNISPLKPEELSGSSERDNTDADVIIRKIRNLLKQKALPEEKREQIILEIERTIKFNGNLNIKRNDNETVLRELFREIREKILPFIENKMLDFAGAIYNKITDWMPLADDEANDVVLTPRYIVDFMVKLAGVNKESYVWDFALGSGGFLISAMNAMLKDAKEKIADPNILKQKELNIKEKQLLGVEKRSDVQMLAILNMFLVGDGSSNILNKDSLTEEFNGNYAYPKADEKFPANVFLLNPPYSAEGNGMIFVKRALSMMKSGSAAVIIQDSAGSGKAVAFNRAILERNALIASIKMPVDLFSGKSSVQTSIYVFKVGEEHNANQIVKFIDLRNDGYKRSNRRRADKSVNLRDVDNAKERYDEVVKYVRYGERPTLIDYEEDKINPKSGADWNFEQHKKIDTRPTEADFRKTVADYLAWEVSQIIKNGSFEFEDDALKKR